MKKCIFIYNIVLALLLLVTRSGLCQKLQHRIKRQGITLEVPASNNGELATQFLGGLAGVAGALFGAINTAHQQNHQSRPGQQFGHHGQPFVQPGQPWNQQRPPFNRPGQPPQVFPQQPGVRPQPVPQRPPQPPAQPPPPQPSPALTQPPMTKPPPPPMVPSSPKSVGETRLTEMLSQCGAPKVSTNRISGATKSAKGAWPWMAALRYVDGDDNVATFCGGSLITKRRVLTAAHCLPGPPGYEIFKVRLGDHNLDLDDDDAEVVERFVAKWVLNEEYDEKTAKNDIAVLILDRDIDFTDFVMPICMPITQNTRSNDFLNVASYIAGWGAKEFAASTSSVLQEAKIRVYSEAQCKAAYTGIRNTIVDSGVICAGVPSGRQDACQGDSGGPLMTSVQGRYYLIGIVSKGLACGTPQVPGIYTRVTSFLDWVINNISK